jgi:hypothetical protein
MVNRKVPSCPKSRNPYATLIGWPPISASRRKRSMAGGRSAKAHPHTRSASSCATASPRLTLGWLSNDDHGHFAEEGWGVEALISAPVVFAIEVVSLFFARALFVWFYNVTAFSVLLVAIFHASFDGAINRLSDDIVPASNTVRFLIFSAVIVLAGTTVIIATTGRLGRAREAVATQTDVSDLDT